MGRLILVGAFLLLISPASAGDVDVEDVRLKKAGDGTFTFSVTLRHADTGWEHYADRWEVLGPDGEVLATRVLYHPHVNEQPFTRSLAKVKIPDGVDRVTIRGHDKLHGYAGITLPVTVSGAGGS